MMKIRASRRDLGVFGVHYFQICGLRLAFLQKGLRPRNENWGLEPSWLGVFMEGSRRDPLDVKG